MSRSGYEFDLDQRDLAVWRGQVMSSIRGKRGQRLLRDLRAAMDAATEKVLAHGARREKRALLLAYFAWACPSGPITAEMLAGATDQEWAQLAHAAHLAERPAGAIHDRHYVPSFETRRLVLAKLRELEKGVVAA